MFLSRWSRRKQDARAANGAERAAPAAAPPLPQREDSGAADTPVPILPAVDELTPDSDFSGFLHPKVAQEVKRAALKKLFSDPRFNVMDGLDIYIDDYSKPDPLPPGMLAQMRSAQTILRWARNESEADESAAAPAAARPVLDNAALPVLPADAPVAVREAVPRSAAPVSTETPCSAPDNKL